MERLSNGQHVQSFRIEVGTLPVGNLSPPTIPSAATSAPMLRPPNRLPESGWNILEFDRRRRK